MAHWTLDDIPWGQFDPGKVKPELVSLVKAASMVEYNGQDYARYLCEVFADDAEFQQAAHLWAEEEIQHGRALRKWAELADPAFDFDKSFKMFTDGYKLPVGVAASVRGSRTGELIARCVVETGTSSYYTAIKDYSDEPVLRAICAKIAADEFRHYKLFYTHLNRYVEKEKISFWKRLAVASGRIAESEDDELAYAYFAAHQQGNANAVYDRKTCTNQYMSRACMLYRRPHIEQMTGMVFKAVGLKPRTRLNKLVDYAVWNGMRFKTRRLEKYRTAPLAA
jgi:rubrerythrin